MQEFSCFSNILVSSGSYAMHLLNRDKAKDFQISLGSSQNLQCFATLELPCSITGYMKTFRVNRSILGLRQLGSQFNT